MLYIKLIKCKMIDNVLTKRVANAPCNAFANAFTVAGVMLYKIKFNADGTVVIT